MINSFFFNLILFITTLSVTGYSPVNDLNVNNYLGRWYQIYQDKADYIFEGKSSCITADYNSINETTIGVLNSEVNRKNEIEQIKGIAYYQEGNSGGELTVQLEDLPPAPYWVIELGPIVDGFYDYSVVSDDKKISLFILTRNISRFFESYEDIVLKNLESFGFDKFYNQPILSNQTNCEYV